MGEILQAALCVAWLFAAFVLAVWAKDDARTRGKPGWLVALMVLALGCLPGLLVWLVFRPDRIATDTRVES